MKILILRWRVTFPLHVIAEKNQNTQKILIDYFKNSLYPYAYNSQAKILVYNFDNGILDILHLNYFTGVIKNRYTPDKVTIGNHALVTDAYLYLIDLN